MNSCALARCGGLQNLGAAGARLAVGDVVPDGPVEQQRLLQYETDLPAEGLLLEEFHIDAVDFDGSGVGIVEARNQVDDGGLACAGRVPPGPPPARAPPSG